MVKQNKIEVTSDINFHQKNSATPDSVGDKTSNILIQKITIDKSIADEPKDTGMDVVKTNRCVEKCSICFELPTVRGIMSGCDHTFCFECILKWSKETNKCPVCKRRFISLTKCSSSCSTTQHPNVKSKSRGRKRMRNEQFVRIKKRDITYRTAGSRIEMQPRLVLNHQSNVMSRHLYHNIDIESYIRERANAQADLRLANHQVFYQERNYESIDEYVRRRYRPFRRSIRSFSSRHSRYENNISMENILQYIYSPDRYQRSSIGNNESQFLPSISPTLINYSLFDSTQRNIATTFR